MALANSEEDVLITADKDFGHLVYRKRQASAGVILLRLAGLSTLQKIEVVQQVIGSHGDHLVGAFSVITPNRIRIRPAA